MNTFSSDAHISLVKIFHSRMLYRIFPGTILVSIKEAFYMMSLEGGIFVGNDPWVNQYLQVSLD